ncbi:hypothetical protein AVEN_87477-1 [Araneus ventricosus]|uniref:Uncharacterized protein n=1 Tax=Araneus ventricosus TaxID=182803 RepID=A0A4Y2KX85_ARAVE|nr:hypothetical protein AVEN_87477-1 [Araneus ventricosus]
MYTEIVAHLPSLHNNEVLRSGTGRGHEIIPIKSSTTGLAKLAQHSSQGVQTPSARHQGHAMSKQSLPEVIILSEDDGRSPSRIPKEAA